MGTLHWSGKMVQPFTLKSTGLRPMDWLHGVMAVHSSPEDGYIEIRKYEDVAKNKSGDHLFLVNKDGEKYYHLEGKVGFPFFGELIKDCIHRTENAMTQEHAFKAAALCLEAQAKVVRITG